MSVADLPPKPAEVHPVADDFTGTQGEKIDKLIVAVTDIRATLRWWGRVASYAVPSLVAFFAFVVVTLYSTSARLDRLADRVEFSEKLTGQRLDALDKRVEAVERQQREANDLLRQLLARQPNQP